MKKGFNYWFRRVMYWLIPVSFFAIANITRGANVYVANGIAGILFVATIYYYVLLHYKVGE